MRAAVEGLGTPYPLISLMPAVYQEDEFARRFTAGFDDVLSSAISTLDCLAEYMDPATAPEDMLTWLAGWVGMALNPDWPEERRRSAVTHAIEFYRLRGTVVGLRRQLELLFGGQVDISDNGGVGWSVSPGGELPGEAAPRLAVRLTTDDAAPRHAEVEAVVVGAKPAHVVHRVEVSAR